MKIKLFDILGRKKLIVIGVEGGVLSIVDFVRKNIVIYFYNFGKYSVGFCFYWIIFLDW